jgi:hypothetical protein
MLSLCVDCVLNVELWGGGGGGEVDIYFVLGAV